MRLKIALVSEHWNARETRCVHRKRDGNRCKINVEAGEYLCEHHNYDFRAFVRYPITVAKRYRKFWGKAHHPACDKKGTLYCDCPDIPDGAILAQALRKACLISASRTTIMKRVMHLEMLKKTRIIKKYYRDIEEDDLWLPPMSNRRQFRIFVYDRRAKRVIVRKIKDCIRGKKDLLKHLRRYGPLHCYYSTSTWLNPQGIGPDPFSKSGRRKFKKQGLYKHYNNTWLGQEFYIDVDYEMKDTTMAAEMTLKVIDWYKQNVRPDAELTIVRSGGKGFHVIDFGYNLEEDIKGSLPRSRPFADAWDVAYKNYTGGTAMTPSAVRQNISRNWKKGMVEQMKRDGLLVDFEVTPDPRRIIRVPGTVHGKKLTVCQVIDRGEIFVSGVPITDL